MSLISGEDLWIAYLEAIDSMERNDVGVVIPFDVLTNNYSLDTSALDELCDKINELGRNAVINKQPDVEPPEDMDQEMRAAIGMGVMAGIASERQRARKHYPGFGH